MGVVRDYRKGGVLLFTFIITFKLNVAVVHNYQGYGVLITIHGEG